MGREIFLTPPSSSLSPPSFSLLLYPVTFACDWKANYRRRCKIYVFSFYVEKDAEVV